MRIDLSGTTDEAYLVECCKRNDPAAQHILYNKYVEDMMILCLRYIAQHEDAKEALMDGFLSFFRGIGSFSYRGEGSVKAWMKKVMVNSCLMHLRKQDRNTILVADTTEYEHKEAGDDILGQLAAKEILRLLHELPDGYRMVFNLYVFEDMTHKDIAEMLGISESTSKSQLHRARALLQKQISQQTKSNENAIG
ncbi:sigma-70 family RNA polymerase sigma factor [Nemorincola caseinilytica]|uniref:Sigma-70 family RNA polymerase sigma factor n=1 Tax=Nemorincola caseinilytica TaxID=2054315 RepID=A0ABP8N4K3_9BACT